MLGFPRLVVKAGVFFLQVAGVGKDDAAQINGGRSCVNRSAKSLLHQARNPSAVVEVGMRQDDRVDFPGRHRRVPPISLSPFFRTLEDSAIDKNLNAVLPRRVSCVDQMLRAGHSARGAKKLDVGQIFLPD